MALLSQMLFMERKNRFPVKIKARVKTPTEQLHTMNEVVNIKMLFFLFAE